MRQRLCSRGDCSRTSKRKNAGHLKINEMPLKDYTYISLCNAFEQYVIVRIAKQLMWKAQTLHINIRWLVAYESYIANALKN